jgi:hypothetical protein
MQANPSCPFGDVEAQTELPVVQIVPEASVHELPVQAREAIDRTREVGLAEYFILV